MYETLSRRLVLLAGAAAIVRSLHASAEVAALKKRTALQPLFVAVYRRLFSTLLMFICTGASEPPGCQVSYLFDLILNVYCVRSATNRLGIYLSPAGH